LLETKSRQLNDRHDELRDMTSALRNPLRRVDAILHNAAEAILTFSGDERIETANRAARAMFGFQDDSIVGTQLTDYLPRIATGGLRETVSTVHDEYLAVRRDGSTFPLEMVVSSAEQSDRQLFIAIARDMTRRSQLDAQLSKVHYMEAAGQLEPGTADALDRPIQTASHNLRYLETCVTDLVKVIEQCRQLARTTSGSALGEMRTPASADELSAELSPKVSPISLDRSAAKPVRGGAARC
jgi:PAS domain S-box-containing protein